MSDLKPTTRDERVQWWADLATRSGTPRSEIERWHRLIADIDRRDAILRRLVEWWDHPNSFDMDIHPIVKDAAKELEESQ